MKYELKPALILYSKYTLIALFSKRPTLDVYKHVSLWNNCVHPVTLYAVATQMFKPAQVVEVTIQ